MNAVLRINSHSSDLARVQFSLDNIGAITDSGLRVTLENATNGVKAEILEATESVHNDAIFVLPEVNRISGAINLKDPRNSAHATLTIYAIIEKKVKDKYELVEIGYTTISVPKLTANSADITSLTVEPSFVEYGSDFQVSINGKPSSDIWLTIANKTYGVKLNESGNGSITINSSSVTSKTSVLQQLRIYVSGEDTKVYDPGCTLQILPETSGQLSFSASSILQTSLEIVNTSEVNALSYPNSGVGETEVGLVKKLTTNGDISFTTAATGDFARVNSYSVCRIAPNAGIVAVAAQDKTHLTDNGITDPAELSRIQSSRVYCLLTQLGTQYSDGYRNARVIDSSAVVNDCADGLIAIRVDSDIWGDAALTKIWILDGDLQGRRFKILSHHRTTQNLWYITPDDLLPVDITNGDCFNFVAYGNAATVSQTVLSSISPLPFVEVNGIAVSSVNPQIATNSYQSASITDRFVYVVTEANINGTAQLFFYSFNLGTGDIFGWQQLTYNGENKNAKLHVDSRNNLHVVWESSRCEPGQICYGVLGADSRAVMNETFISALDKQSALRIDKLSTPTDSNDLNTLLVTIGTPHALNLRGLNEYGVPSGSMWTTFVNGGTATITDDGTLTCSGNPKNSKFAAFASLINNENGAPLNTEFSQLSYQIAFNLSISSSIVSRTKDQIKDLYKTWKSGFTPLKSATKNVNIYSGANSNRYTIGECVYIFDKIIPIAGSYKADVLNSSLPDQLRLRHFMFAIVPERVRFLATNAESSDAYVARGNTLGNYSAYQQTEYFTGKFKLALITETSANISDKSLAGQHYHIVRLFGEPLDITTSHSYAIAVHYSKLREDHLSYRVTTDIVDGLEQNVRFSGDIIVVVDNKVQGADTFIPDFSDEYDQFDIGLGVPMLGEYRPFNTKPFDGTLNQDLSIVMNFTSIAIGPHTVVAHPTLVSFAKTDRNVAKMYIGSAVNEQDSLTISEEIYGIEYGISNSSRYLLDLGLHQQKIRLSQVPVTFSGRNSSPSSWLDRDGKIHIAYQSNRDGNWEIYYTNNRDAGIPFRFDSRISSSVSDSLMPSVSVDDMGRRLIAWHDNRSGSFQVYAARTTKPVISDGRCIRDQLRSDLGFVDNGELQDSAYEYIEDFASICQLHFNFTNSGTTRNFHFVAGFYFDVSRISLAKFVDSRFDISNWSVKKSGKTIPMPYNGIPVANGESIEVFYDISKEDNLSDEIYYVTISSDDGLVLNELRTIEFFCPVSQRPLCRVPVLYTNHSGASQSVHFRTTVYSDAAMTKTVLSADTTLDQRKWRTGDFKGFPASGLAVAAGDTVSLSYDPDILPLELSKWQNGTVESLLCNTKYYVKVESYLSSTYTVLDSFAFECSCDDIGANVWREDRISQDWICSGQGGSDIRITAGERPSFYPQVAAAQDGTFYIAWEDLRLTEEKEPHSPSLYFTVWDANADKFYSRSQGYFDKTIIENGYFRPQLLITNLQHIAVFFTNGKGVFRNTLSLYQPPQVTSASSGSQLNDFLFPPSVLSLTSNDLASCVGMDVYEKDIVRLYHETSDKPLALVDNCRIRFDIRCPHGTYAVRFKNENNTEFSAWIPVLPKLYSASSSSGAIAIQDFLQAYSISDDRFISEWVLSAGNGNKTVSCEVMTFFGKTPVITRNIIARYKQLSYSIKFFSSGTSVAASMFNGYPVISTKSLEVSKGNVASIQSSTSDTGVITIQVTFDDPDYLDELLSLLAVDLYGGIAPVLTFNVIMPGKTLRELPLTKVDDTTVSFDYDNPPLTASHIGRGVYTGTFPIEKADGFDNIDGEAIVVLNIPSPCLLPMEDVIPCDNNRKTPEDIKLQIANEVLAVPVDKERFRYAYSPDMICSFTTPSCVTGSEPQDATSIFDDDVQFPPEFSGPVQCEVFEWNSPKRAEPCYFFRNSLNSTRWVVESDEFELDFFDQRIDYLKFSTDSVLDDILIMIKPNETITFTPSLGLHCPDPASSSSSNDGTYGRSVTFTVPQKSIIFSHKANPLVNFYCHGPSECNFGSAQKVFNVTGASTIITIPEGSYANDKTDGGATWSIPAALGKNYNTLSPPDQTDASNCLLASLVDGIAKIELQSRGFVTAGGTLRFKLVHISSGIGYAHVRGITCGVSC